jgi:hypothetical protein
MAERFWLRRLKDGRVQYFIDTGSSDGWAHGSTWDEDFARSIARDFGIDQEPEWKEPLFHDSVPPTEQQTRGGA